MRLGYCKIEAVSASHVNISSVRLDYYRPLRYVHSFSNPSKVAITIVPSSSARRGGENIILVFVENIGMSPTQSI